MKARLLKVLILVLLCLLPGAGSEVFSASTVVAITDASLNVASSTALSRALDLQVQTADVAAFLQAASSDAAYAKELFDKIHGNDQAGVLALIQKKCPGSKVSIAEFEADFHVVINNIKGGCTTTTCVSSENKCAGGKNFSRNTVCATN